MCRFLTRFGSEHAERDRSYQLKLERFLCRRGQERVMVGGSEVQGVEFGRPRMGRALRGSHSRGDWREWRESRTRESRARRVE